MSASKTGRSVSLSDVWIAFQEDRLGSLSPKTQENYTRAARLIPASRKAAGSYSSANIYKLIKHLPPGAYMVARGFFSSLFSFAIRRGWAASNPVAHVETRKLGKIARWARESVVEGLSNIDNEEARLVMETMYASGQRISDVLAIRPENIQGQVLRLKQKKTGNEIEVPLGAEITNKLVAKFRDSGQTIFQISAQKVWREWRKVRPAAMAKYTPHSLRKAASCEAAEGGASEAELQALLGHKTARAAAIYRLEADRAVMASSAMAKRGLM